MRPADANLEAECLRNTRGPAPSGGQWADSPTDNPYSGAKIAWKTVEPVNGDPTTTEPAALAAKWHKQNVPGGQIGAVMGAFYAMLRSWYTEMGEPWIVGTAWGTDEELISIASYLCGGDVRLLPARIEVTHRMSDPKTNPDRWAATGADIDGIWLNRFRVVHLFPLSDTERSELLEHLSFNAHTVLRPGWARKLLEDRARPEVEKLRQHFAGRVGEWTTYHNRWIEHPPVDQVQATAALYAKNRGQPYPPVATPATAAPAAPPDPRYKAEQQIVHRRTEICSLCDARNSFRVVRTMGTRRYAKCSNCGRPVVILETGEIKSGGEMYPV
jgi:hypothetical protein